MIGYEGYYCVSNYGRVMAIYKANNQYKDVRMLKQNEIKGYMHVQLHKKGVCHSKRVHRLVCEAFKPNPENKPHVNHLDEVKSNNHLDNLEWCTPSENEIHKHKMGYKPKKKLTEAQIEEIIQEYETYSSTGAELADRFGVSVTTIMKYVVLKKGAKGTGNGAAKLNETQIPEIRHLRESGATYTEIAKKFGVSYQTISRICKGQNWTHS